MSSRQTDIDRLLSNLIVRLHKICTHSLSEQSIVEKYRKPYRVGKDGVIRAMGAQISQNGGKFSGMKFSDEFLDPEKFESLAARCRPLTLQDGSESLQKIMNRVRTLVPNMHRQYDSMEINTFQNEIDVLQALWSFYSSKSRDFEATSKRLRRLDREDLAAMIEKQRLFLCRSPRLIINDEVFGGKTLNLMDVGYQWIYADLVHNDFAARDDTYPHTEEERYECAIPYVFSIVYMCLKYLGQIKSMEAGISELFHLTGEAKSVLDKVELEE